VCVLERGGEKERIREGERARLRKSMRVNDRGKCGEIERVRAREKKEDKREGE